MPIVFRASEVAAVIGKNPFTSRPRALAEAWKRYSPESFDASRLLHTHDDDEEYPIDHAVVDQLVQCADDPTVVVDALLAHTSSSPSPCHRATREAVYTEFGRRREASCLEKSRTMSGIQWISPCDPKTVWLGHVQNIPFGVCGVADGISPDGDEILEIKNRMKKLHCRVPAHEYIQIQSYVRLYGAEKARLVEFFGNAHSTIKIFRDDAAWDDVITPGLAKAARDIAALSTT
jgi:hypothetical protein